MEILVVCIWKQSDQKNGFMLNTVFHSLSKWRFIMLFNHFFDKKLLNHKVMSLVLLKNLALLKGLLKKAELERTIKNHNKYLIIK